MACEGSFCPECWHKHTQFSDGNMQHSERYYSAFEMTEARFFLAVFEATLNFEFRQKG